MDYNSYLFEQFITARGYKKYINGSLFLGEEFYNWLREQQYFSKKYLDFVKTVTSYELNKPSTIELNKGKLDYMISDGTLVSPFAYTLNKPCSSLIIDDENVEISEGEELYSTDEYNMFVTHNAYRKSYTDIILELSNIGNNICYGIFGRNSDKDKDDKLELLYNLFKECGDKANVEYDNLSDTYYGVIYTKEKALKKVR